jgi:hypothetical protein
VDDLPQVDGGLHSVLVLIHVISDPPVTEDRCVRGASAGSQVLRIRGTKVEELNMPSNACAE